MRRSRSLGAALVGVVVFVVVVAPGRGGLGPDGARAQAEDAGLLRELAVRLLSPPGGPPGVELPRARLFTGTVPPDLAIDLPLPPGSRVIGSVVRPSPRPQDFANTEIVLDAPGSAAAIVSFYQSALTERGWFVPPVGGPPQGGFQATLAPASRLFCESPKGPFISLSVYPMRTGPSDVRVNVNTGSSGPCSAPSVPQGPGVPPGFDVLPRLTPPAAVEISTANTVPARPGVVSSDATAETDVSVTDLEAHFAQQLAAAGWTRLDGGAQGPLAWSVWAVPGEQKLQGFLYVLDGPGQGRRSLHVQAASPEPLAFPFR